MHHTVLNKTFKPFIVSLHFQKAPKDAQLEVIYSIPAGLGGGGPLRINRITLTAKIIYNVSDTLFVERRIPSPCYPLRQ